MSASRTTAARSSPRPARSCSSKRSARPVFTRPCPRLWLRGANPRAVHDPGKALLDLAPAVALGGGCLADVAMLRCEPAVFGPVASDPTVSRLINPLAASGEKALQAVRSARYSVGMVITEIIHQHVPKIPAPAWTPAVEADGKVRDGAWVAELTGSLLAGWPEGMRPIVRKERPRPGPG